MRPDQVEPALGRLWAERGEQARAARVRTVNLVAVCGDRDCAPRALQVAEEILPTHPGRAIVVREGASGAHGISAEAGLVSEPGGAGRAVGERVVLDVSGGARAFVPEQVDRLLAPGGRVCLWWVGDLPDDDHLYARLTEFADLVTLDSGEMDLRDVRTLWRLVSSAQGRYAMADMNWTRLRPWQEMLARFFDDPVVCAQLAHASALSIAVAGVRPGAVEEPSSPQAALFAGWFASRVGARTQGARWTVLGGIASASLPRDHGTPLALRFEVGPAVQDLPPGTLLRVGLSTEKGATFELSRSAEDPRVLGWQGSCSDAVIPQAVLRVHEPSETRLLSRLLDSPMRNQLFESSLRAAAEFIAPLYDNR